MSKKMKYTVREGNGNKDKDWYATSKKYPHLVGVGYSPCMALEGLLDYVQWEKDRGKKAVK